MRYNTLIEELVFFSRLVLIKTRYPGLYGVPESSPCPFQFIPSLTQIQDILPRQKSLSILPSSKILTLPTTWNKLLKFCGVLVTKAQLLRQNSKLLKELFLIFRKQLKQFLEELNSFIIEGSISSLCPEILISHIADLFQELVQTLYVSLSTPTFCHGNILWRPYNCIKHTRNC